MTKYFFEKRWKEFESYFNTKNISSTIRKKFISSLRSYIKDDKESLIQLMEIIRKNRHLPLETSLKNINLILINKEDGYKILDFIAEWNMSYLGSGEILILLISQTSYSGGKRNPDILFIDSNKKMEVKAYNNNFRLTESTYFFTDLGTIIQALVQGGFLESLTDINNNDLRKGLRYLCESFTAKRGFIELDKQIWKLESKTDKKMVFKASPNTPREIINYSIVRNSLRNWLGRGLLSLKLADIIDPTRVSKIQRSELVEYVRNILGIDDLSPIPLEQYFGLCGLESIILYENKNKKEPFQMIKYNDLKLFTIDRIGQSKVSYKKKLPTKYKNENADVFGA